MSGDEDNDGICDDGDPDDDNDGVLDDNDNCDFGNLDWISNGSTDSDGDGCHDTIEDMDDDNDGCLDDEDDSPYSWDNDYDGDNEDGDCHLYYH